MVTVAIASENDAYDAEVYRVLLSRILGAPVERWQTDIRFDGHRAVVKYIDTFLRGAAEGNVEHALVAVDNDGGAKRHPEHDDAHDMAAHVADEDGCRVCHVSAAIPSWWTEQRRRHCVVVPVQTLETWLLCLRGHAFKGEPEGAYDRATLKKSFFGKPFPPVAGRTKLALAEIERPDALTILEQRQSFRRLRAQVADWR